MKLKDIIYKAALKLLPYSDIRQGGEVYLRTFFVWRPKWSEKLFGRKTGGIYVHQFLKSDNEAPHDHSWPFTSIILRGGYHDISYRWDDKYGLESYGYEELKPGDVVTRKPSHIHNVVLKDENVPAWTLMFVGPVERDFCFYTNRDGPVLWWRHLGFKSKPD